MKKIIFALLILVPTLALAKTGPYIQLQAGDNRIMTDAPNVPNSSMNFGYYQPRPLASNGFAAGINEGYQWTKNKWTYGAELGQLIYPDTSSHHYYSYKGFNVDLLGVVKYKPFYSLGALIFVKAGIAYVTQTFTYKNVPYPHTTIPPLSGTHSGKSFEPEVDIGLGYQLNKNLEIDFTCNGVGGSEGLNLDQPNDYFGKVVGSNNYLLGLTYHFA